MFTGIVEGQGQVLRLEHSPETLQIHLSTGWNDLALGESIAVNGVCLTVTKCSPSGEAIFFVSSETLHKTNLKILNINDFLNLERALTLQSRLSGHWVQGHVDGIAHLRQLESSSEAHQLRFEIPSHLARYCVEKGSITLNGVSLTINSVASSQGVTMIEVMIIPHTWTFTNLSRLKIDDPVNIEVDILAKYAEKMLERVCYH